MARGKIAVVNMTNSLLDLSVFLNVWEGQPEWDVLANLPTITADRRKPNLTAANEAGVKGVIIAWDNMTSGNAYGQYIPFKELYLGVPTLYVAGPAAETVMEASKTNQKAQLTLTGELIPDTETRTIYTVIEGTKYKDESNIITTHTDGINAIEENGHIAMLAEAKSLATCPPERTTILVFLTGHMHQPAFSTTGKATKRWLDDNTKYWRGEEGEMTAVVSSCVEHLGALDWVEDLATNSYYPTGELVEETLFANTPELVDLMEQNWNGTNPDLVRINKPSARGTQPGEGEDLHKALIPEFSLITGTSYLLAELPEDFNEMRLVDMDTLKRQVDSLLRMWDAVGMMPTGSFGVAPESVEE